MSWSRIRVGANGRETWLFNVRVDQTRVHIECATSRQDGRSYLDTSGEADWALELLEMLGIPAERVSGEEAP